MDPESESHAEIRFEHPEGTGSEPQLKLSGVPTELARSPEKIRQLMELLDLPKGTNARVTVATSSVIIR